MKSLSLYVEKHILPRRKQYIMLHNIIIYYINNILYYFQHDDKDVHFTFIINFLIFFLYFLHKLNCSENKPYFELFLLELQCYYKMVKWCKNGQAFVKIFHFYNLTR